VTAEDDDGAVFAELSAKLRDTHRRVASLEAPNDEKASITKRLLVITDASKHDLRRALARLDALIAELPEPPADR
jgi:hypothetical protein